MRRLPLGLAIVALVGCPPPPIGDLARSELTGLVSMGSPVSKATVSIYSVGLDATRGELLASAEADEQGRVRVSLPLLRTSALACASGGFFSDLVTGSLVRFEDFELCAYLPEVGTSMTFAITPWTHLVNIEMQYLTLVYSLSLKDAFTKATIDLDSFLTCSSPDLDVTRASPVDPSIEREQDLELTGDVLAGILLGGLSAQAAVISENLGYTPGVRFTPLTLVEGFSEDLLSNMKFDGVGTTGRIILEGYEFTASTFRFSETGFVRGLLEFLQGDVNRTSVTAADTQDLMLCLSTTVDPLFSVEGTELDLAGPTISFLSPSPTSTVRGTFDVVVSADDPSGVESLVFLDGQDFLTSRQESHNGTTREVRATVDGNSLPSGPLTVAVEARDIYGNATTSTATFTLEPYVPGTLYGRVSLDTPVLHATVEVLDFTDGVRGTVLATQASTDGNFSLPMPEHAGPILIRAFGTSSGYLDLATGQPVYFTAGDELVTFLDYDGQSGAIYQDISVNALTTLATHLGLVLQAGGQDLGTAMNHAYQLFGKHLERTTNPDGVDIARTSVSDLSTGSSSDPPKSIFMGLMHIGLSRWGASAATSQGLARTALPSLDVLKLLERDLSSGVLSGRDEFGAPIHATPNQAVQVVTNTLRIELAREISRWLASMPLPDASVTANPTALRPSNFTVAGGFFDALALDTSELFSAFDPTVAVDAAPPAISFVTPTSGSDVAGAVTISVTASDNEGVYSLQFAGGQDWITGRSSSVSGTSGHLIGQLDATGLPEGPLTITAAAMDLFGNARQASVTVNVITIPDGTIGGRVFLDTPVSDVTVEALDFTDGVRGAVLDSMTAQDGSFSLQIPFTHDGPVLIRGFGTASTYKNMALNLPQTFTSSDELTLVVNYGAAGDGTNLAGRSVNAISTMATRFIERKVATGALGLDEAISLAFQLLGSHLDRPGTAPYGLNVS
ncbi:MAG: Ig-like domain-containing protein, partial [Pseudomonadota bacterium]